MRCVSTRLVRAMRPRWLMECVSGIRRVVPRVCEPESYVTSRVGRLM